MTTSLIRLSRDYRHIQKSPVPYIQTHPRADNILVWPYLITGPPETPYAGGQYYGTLQFPENFPFAAPSVRMVTPSGRFVPNNVICTTFTSLHPEEWNPAWTVETILVGFLSFMTGDDPGMGTVHQGDVESRKKYAKESKVWNSLECLKFGQDFPEEYAANMESGDLTEANKELLKSRQELWNAQANSGPGPAVHDRMRMEVEDSPFNALSYEEHIKEDWEKFGSMEEEDDEDFDYYEGDSEEDEECETPETEVEGVDEGES